jgi:EmrB/QacA subfamily drug resistance transporter
MVVAVAAFGAFLAFLDSTIVIVAIPSIQASFPKTPLGLLSWVLNAYNIVFAAFLIAAGRIADLLGRRRTFTAGMVIFTLASVGCALGSSLGALIFFRTVQAAGAALLVPASLAIVVEAFPAGRRARAVGLWGAAAAIAAGLGPPFGGALVAAAGWRLVFVVNVPLGVAAVALGRRLLTESRAPKPCPSPDLRGAGLVAVALAALTLGVVEGADWGWASPGIIVAFAASVVATAGLVARFRRHRSSAPDAALLGIRPFAVATTITMVAGAGFYASLLTHILWLHHIWAYPLWRAGLAVVPGAVVAVLVVAILSRVANARGHRWVALPGALVWAGGLLWYLLTVGGYPDFLTAWLPGQVISGVGAGATLSALAGVALATVPRGRWVAASVTIFAARHLGAVMGIAILVVLLGTLVPSSAATELRHGWALSAVCFVMAAVGAAFLHPTAPVGNGDVAEVPADLARLPVGAAAPAQSEAAPGTVLTLPPPQGDAERSPLADLPLFASLPAPVRAGIEAGATVVDLPAGGWLFHQGEPADGLYTVRSGRLEVVRDGAVINELGRGAILGELSLLTGSARSASVRARRDSQLLRLSREQFATITTSQPEVLHKIAATVAGWLQTSRPQADSANRPRVVAVVGCDDAAPVQAVAEVLVSELARHLTVAAPGLVNPAGLERAELAADRVVLVAETGDDQGGDAQWRAFCLRQADRVILVASSTVAPPPALAAQGADLVLVGPRPVGEALRCWYDVLGPRRSYVLGSEPQELADRVRALARRIAGVSVGLVLGGGGARAFTHIGVIEELEAAGIQVDRVAGTSVGAYIGACYAAGMNPDMIDVWCREEFIRRNPFGDYTLPRLALSGGRRARAGLVRCFGDLIAEELPREFCCLSVDLLARETVTHRRGSVVDAVRASISLPVLYPPYPIGNRLHVDGGLLDNLPVSAMTECEEGPIIAVSISFRDGAEEQSGTPRIPAMSETLMRSIMMASTTAVEAAQARADLVISPDARGVGLLEFHQLERMRVAGRTAARAALAGWSPGRRRGDR